jgi:hypothetical protein
VIGHNRDYKTMPIDYLLLATKISNCITENRPLNITDEEKVVLPDRTTMWFKQLFPGFDPASHIASNVKTEQESLPPSAALELPPNAVSSPKLPQNIAQQIVDFVQILKLLLADPPERFLLNIETDLPLFFPDFFSSTTDLRKFLQASGFTENNQNLEQLKTILACINSNLNQTLQELFPNKKIWYEFIIKKGKSIIDKYLLRSDIKQITEKLPKQITKLSTEQIELAHAKFSFGLPVDAAQIDPRTLELAILCHKYKRKPESFNLANNMLPFLEKKDDQLPNIFIDGTELGYPNFYYTKLPANDLRGFVLGEITHCCQSIGENAQNVAIAGMTNAFSGFYCIFKRKDSHSNANPKSDDIVGQSYMWLSQQGNFVLDSLEIVGQCLAFGDQKEGQHTNTLYASVNFLRALAAHILYTTERKLFLGTGGGTAD